MEGLQLTARFIVRTSKLKISRRRPANYVENWTQKRVAGVALLFFLIFNQSNHWLEALSLSLVWFICLFIQLQGNHFSYSTGINMDPVRHRQQTTTPRTPCPTLRKQHLGSLPSHMQVNFRFDVLSVVAALIARAHFQYGCMKGETSKQAVIEKTRNNYLFQDIFSPSLNNFVGLLSKNFRITPKFSSLCG